MKCYTYTIQLHIFQEKVNDGADTGESETSMESPSKQTCLTAISYDL